MTPRQPPYHLPPPFSPVSLHPSSLQERGWKRGWDSHFRPWSLSLAVGGRWRCACWWPPPFSPWQVVGACVWAGAGTWGRPAARPPWHCRRISAEGNTKTRTGFRPLLLSKWYHQEKQVCSTLFYNPPPPQLGSGLPQGKMVTCTMCSRRHVAGNGGNCGCEGVGLREVGLRF